MDRCFTGTTTRIQGSDFEALYRDLERFHSAGYPQETSESTPLVQNHGELHYRDDGEAHLNNPMGMVNLQVRQNCFIHETRQHLN